MPKCKLKKTVKLKNRIETGYSAIKKLDERDTNQEVVKDLRKKSENVNLILKEYLFNDDRFGCGHM